MVSRKVIYWIVQTVGIVSLLGCGGSGTSSPTIEPAQFEQPALPLGEQLSQLETPEKISDSLWEKLTAKLSAEVEALGTGRQTASAPNSPGSQINDLQVVATGGEPRLQWTYRNTGDYDQNGEVNAADLTPIAVHFSKSAKDSGWQAAQIADGDGNGEVNLADVTPIAVHFNTRVAGYQVQVNTGYAEPDEWPVATITVPFSESQIDNFRRHFDIETNLGDDDGLTRVAPVESLDEPGTPGLASNASIYLVGATAPGDWAMPGHDRRHTNRSNINVPERIGPVWNQRIAPDDGVFHYKIESPVVDAEGNIFVAGGYGIRALDQDGTERWGISDPVGYGSGSLMIAPNGMVLATGSDAISPSSLGAIHPDSGIEIWRRNFVFKCSSPVMDPQGRIVVFNREGVFCINQDGTDAWTFPIGGQGFPVQGTSIDSNGFIYAAVNLLGAWGEYFRPGMVVLDKNGHLRWVLEQEPDIVWTSPDYQRITPRLLSAPLILDDGRIVIQTHTKISCYTNYGEQVWEYHLESEYAEIFAGLALTPEGSIVAGVNDPASDPQYAIVYLSSGGDVIERQKTQFDIGNSVRNTFANGSTLYESEANWLYALGADGELSWQLNPSFGEKHLSLTNGLCFRDDGTLIVVSAGEVFCFDSAAPDYIEPPATVTASQGEFIDHVNISWTAVPFAESYVVYREDRAVPLVVLQAEDLGELAYEDYAAQGTTPLEYWVTVATVQGESTPSPPAIGFTAPTGITNSGAGDWAQPYHDHLQNSQSGVSGPLNPHELWTYEYAGLDGSVPGIHSSPVFSADGTGYLITQDDSSIISVSPDGVLNWRYRASYAISHPVLNHVGDILFTTYDSLRLDLDGQPPSDPYRLVSLKPDRNVNWEVPLSGRPKGLTIGPDGNTYFCMEPGSLLSCDPQGSLATLNDTLQVEFFSYSAPAISDEGAIFLSLLYNAYLYNNIALTGQGEILWEENDAVLSLGAFALGNFGEIYSGTFPAYRFDTSGNILWESNHFALTMDNRVVVGPDNSFYARLANEGDDNGKVGRFNPDGELLQIYHEPPELLAFLSLVVDAQNNLYGITQDGASVVGINAAGNLLWQIESPAGSLFGTDHKLGIRDDGVLVIATETGLVALGD